MIIRIIIQKKWKQEGRNRNNDDERMTMKKKEDEGEGEEDIIEFKIIEINML